MKRFISLLLSVMIAASAFAFCVKAETSFVSDNEAVSSEGVTAQIEDLFRQLDNKNTCKVYFNIVNSLNGEGASAAAERLYNEKGLDKSGDFGIVFVLAATDGDYYLKVGGALSNVITADVSKTLLATFEEQFSGGMIDAGLFALANEICTKLTPLSSPDESSGTSILLIILIVILVILFLAVVAFIILYVRAERIRRARRRRNRNMMAQRRFGTR